MKVCNLTEARIEQAKRIQRSSEYIKLSNNEKGMVSGSSSGLIPIQRLPIPHKSNEYHPLVEYWRSDSERFVSNSSGI